MNIAYIQAIQKIIQQYLDEPVQDTAQVIGEYRKRLNSLWFQGNFSFWLHDALLLGTTTDMIAKAPNQLKQLLFFYDPEEDRYHQFDLCNKFCTLKCPPTSIKQLHSTDYIYNYETDSPDGDSSDFDESSDKDPSEAHSDELTDMDTSAPVNTENNDSSNEKNKAESTVTQTEENSLPVKENVENTSSDSNIRLGLYFIPPEHYATIIQQATALDPSVSCKMIGNNLKMIFQNESAFNEILKVIQTEKIPYRFTDPRTSKPLKFLIKGLPPSTPPDDILDALREHGIQPIRTVYLRNNKTKAPMPLFMVAISPTENAESTILEIKNLCHLPVMVKHFTNKKPMQCYRCMGFSHGSFQCQLPVACLLCAKSHSAKDCPVRGNPKMFVCKNCGLNHAANWHKCPKNPNNLKNKSEQKEKTSKDETSNQAVKNVQINSNSEFPPLAEKPMNSPNENKKQENSSELTWAERTQNSLTTAEMLRKPRNQHSQPKTKISLETRAINRKNASQDASTNTCKCNTETPTVNPTQPNGAFLEFMQAFRQTFGDISLPDLTATLTEVTNILKSEDNLLAKITRIITLITPIIQSMQPKVVK